MHAAALLRQRLGSEPLLEARNFASCAKALARLTRLPHARRNVHLAVLDADGGLVGAALLSASASPSVTLSITFVEARSLASLRADVDRGVYHAALVAMPGASAALAAANRNVSAHYDASSALAFFYDEGRGGLGLAPLLRAANTQLTADASAAAARALLAAASAAGAAAGDLNPAALLAPVGCTVHNLHPAAFAGEHTAAGLAYIDLWIVMLAATNSQLANFDQTWGRPGGIRRDHAVYARLAHETLIAGALAFWPPVIMAGLGTPLVARQFFALWAFIWLSMFTFGMIITALMRNLGPARGNVVHTAFLILNLVSSAAVTPTELMPPFFRIGLGLPFFNAVQGTRTILFGSYDRLGRNVGVLIAWIGLMCLFAARAARKFRAELRAAGKL
jgi:hypothetical protein